MSISGTNTNSHTFMPFTGARFINDCVLQPMLHVNHPLLQFADITNPLLSTVALSSRFYSHRIQTWAIKAVSFLAGWILRFQMQYAIEIGSNCDFQDSQGSVETYLRWGGESLWRVCTKFPQESESENFVNRSTFAEVMIKSQVHCFLLRHSVQWSSTSDHHLCLSDIDSPATGSKRFDWVAQRAALLQGGNEVHCLRLSCSPWHVRGSRVV